jgi:hypothetical protein
LASYARRFTVRAVQRVDALLEIVMLLQDLHRNAMPEMSARRLVTRASTVVRRGARGADADRQERDANRYFSRKREGDKPLT